MSAILDGYRPLRSHPASRRAPGKDGRRLHRRLPYAGRSGLRARRPLPASGRATEPGHRARDRRNLPPAQLGDKSGDRRRAGRSSWPCAVLAAACRGRPHSDGSLRSAWRPHDGGARGQDDLSLLRRRLRRHRNAAADGSVRCGRHRPSGQFRAPMLEGLGARRNAFARRPAADAAIDGEPPAGTRRSISSPAFHQTIAEHGPERSPSMCPGRS